MQDDRLVEAALKFTSGEWDSQIAFLREHYPDLADKSNSRYFSTAVAVCTPEWQEVARKARKRGSGSQSKTKHKKSYLKLAAMVFEKRNEAKKAPRTTSTVEMQKAIEVKNLASSSRSSFDKLTKSLVTASKANSKLSLQNQTLEETLLHNSDSLAKERRNNKKLERENKRIRQQVAMLRPDSTSSELLVDQQTNKRLKVENTKLKEKLTCGKNLFSQTELTLEQERQVNQQIRIEISKLGYQLECLDDIYRHAIQTLSFQSNLVQKEEAKRMEAQSRLVNLQQQQLVVNSLISVGKNV